MLRRAPMPEDSPEWLAELLWTFDLVLARFVRRVVDADQRVVWLIPASADGDDPGDVRLWVFVESDEHRSATAFASSERGFDPAAAATVGGIVLGIAPDGVVAVTLETPDGRAVPAGVAGNVWFVGEGQAPLDSRVVVA